MPGNPDKQETDSTVVTQEADTFEAAIQRVEMRAQRIIGWLMIATIILVNLIFHSQMQGLSQRYHLGVLGLSALLVLWFALLALVVRQGFYHRYLKFVNILIQVSTVTLFLLMSAQWVNPVFALTSAAPSFYLLIVGMSSLTFNPKVPLVGACFAVAQYLGAYGYWLDDLLQPGELAVNTIGWPAVLLRSVVILVMGVAAMVISLQARRLLSRAMNQAVHQARVTALEEDMALAAEIQARLIPGELQDSERYVMTSFYRPAGLVGGDYFDIIPAGQDSLYAVIADVSGKGSAAALLMSNIQAITRLMVREGRDLRDMVRILNESVHTASARGRFVTLAAMHLDTWHDEIHYINAGHNPPLLHVPGGGLQELGDADPVLGVVPNQVYQLHTLPFPVGSSLFAYTDGLSEALNQSGEDFHAILRQVIESHAGVPPEQVRQAILERLAAHLDGRDPHDDMTFFCICRRQ